MEIRVGTQLDLVKKVVEKISSVLMQNIPVALFVSGGSSLIVEEEIIKRLSKMRNADKLHVLPVDERFGEPGHKDANLAQLVKNNYENIHIHDILNNSSFEKTVTNFTKLFNEYSKAPFKTFAILGIGMDGHVGGNIPGSPAVISKEMVVGFQDQIFRRITLTLSALTKIETIFVSVFGANKMNILQRLVDKPTENLPMDILHKHKEVYVFTDNNLKQEKE